MASPLPSSHALTLSRTSPRSIAPRASSCTAPIFRARYVRARFIFPTPTDARLAFTPNPCLCHSAVPRPHHHHRAPLARMRGRRRSVPRARPRIRARVGFPPTFFICSSLHTVVARHPSLVIMRGSLPFQAAPLRPLSMVDKKVVDCLCNINQ